MEMLRKLGDKLRRFMYGRYGSDKLNLFLLGLGVVLCLVGSFSRLYFLGLFAYVPLVLAIFGCTRGTLPSGSRKTGGFSSASPGCGTGSTGITPVPAVARECVCRGARGKS